MVGGKKEKRKVEMFENPIRAWGSHPSQTPRDAPDARWPQKQGKGNSSIPCGEGSEGTEPSTPQSANGSFLKAGLTWSFLPLIVKLLIAQAASFWVPKSPYKHKQIQDQSLQALCQAGFPQKLHLPQCPLHGVTAAASCEGNKQIPSCLSLCSSLPSKQGLQLLFQGKDRIVFTSQQTGAAACSFYQLQSDPAGTALLKPCTHCRAEIPCKSLQTLLTELCVVFSFKEFPHFSAAPPWQHRVVWGITF